MAKLVPIRKEEHKNLKVSAKRNLSHVAGAHIAKVYAREYAQAATSFPVVFIKDGEHYRSVVMMGLEAGQNLYLNDEKFDSLFVPSSVGMVPFGLGLHPEKEKTLTACIDIESPFVGEDKDQALFDESGEDTEFYKGVQDALGRLYDNEVSTEKFINEMVENDLMHELELNVAYANGENKKLVGIFTLDEKKMQSLSDEKALDFYKRGLFIPMHAMLGSLGQVNRLVQLSNRYSDKKVNGIQIRSAAEAQQQAS